MKIMQTNLTHLIRLKVIAITCHLNPQLPEIQLKFNASSLGKINGIMKRIKSRKLCGKQNRLRATKASPKKADSQNGRKSTNKKNLPSHEIL